MTRAYLQQTHAFRIGVRDRFRVAVKVGVRDRGRVSLLARLSVIVTGDA